MQRTGSPPAVGTTHINRLRAKLESDPMRPQLILTARGAGYKMRDVP